MPTNLLNQYREYLISEGITSSSIRNYVSDVRKILEICQNPDKPTHEEIVNFLSNSEIQKLPIFTQRRYATSSRRFINFLEAKSILAPSAEGITQTPTLVTPVLIPTSTIARSSNKFPRFLRTPHFSTSSMVWALIIIASILGLMSYNKGTPQLIADRVKGEMIALDYAPSPGSVLPARITVGELVINPDTRIKGLLTAENGINTNGADVDMGTGNLTAGNVVYSITAGTGVTITGGAQTPNIAVGLPANLVTTVQDATGDVVFEAGTGISIDGLTFSSTVTLDDVVSEGDCASCITDAMVVDGLTISGGNIDAASITSGVVTVPFGGTGLTAVGVGELLIGSGTSTMTVLPIGANGEVLTLVGGTPSWEAAAGGAGDITSIGSVLSGAAFNSSSADDNWLGLGAGAGRISFDDQTRDQINILDANLNIGGSTVNAFALNVNGNTNIGGTLNVNDIAVTNISSTNENVGSSLTVSGGSMLVGPVTTQNNLGVGSSLTVASGSRLVGNVTTGGNLAVGGSLDVTSGALFRSTINSLGNITLGNGTSVASPALLGLDLGILAGDPSGTNGAMYYNANTNKFRCYQNGAWTDCITTPSGGTPFADGGNSFGVSAELGTLDAFPLTFLTNGAGRMFISTTGLVGIGTSSPSQLLDVAGNGNITGSLSVGNSLSTGTLTTTGNSTVGGSLSVTGNTMLVGPVTTQNNLSVGGSLDVTSGALFRSSINSLGNITLGTGTSVASPALLKLDLGILAGDPTGSNGAMYYNANTNKFRCYQSGIWVDCISAAIAGTPFADGGNAFGVSAELGTLDTFALTFLTDGAGRMFISTTGLVGIGTSSPSQLLDVAGNANVTGSLSVGNTISTGTLTTTGNTTVGGSLSVTGNTMLVGPVTTQNNLSVGGSLDVTSGALFRSSINSLGNITLGTGTSVASPALLKLDLGILAGDPSGTNGAMYYNANTNEFRCYRAGAWENCGAAAVTDSGAFVDGGNSFGVSAELGTLDTNTLSFLTNGAGRMFISTAGLVGIGTSSPTQRLDVSGNTNIGGTLSVTDSITVNGLTLSDSSIRDSGILNLGANGVTAQFLTVQALFADITLGTSGGANLSIDSAGTTYLSDNVEVSGTLALNGGSLSSVATTWDLANSSTNSLNIETGLLNLDTTNSFVGIGTTAPSSKLNVIGGITLGTGTSVASPALLKLDLGMLAGDPTGSNGAIYYNANTNKFRCYQNGAWANCISEASASGFVDGGNSFGASAELGTLDTNSLAFLTNGAGRMFISSTGLVGIGTSSPTMALDINGSENISGSLSVGGTLNVTGASNLGLVNAQDNLIVGGSLDVTSGALFRSTINSLGNVTLGNGTSIASPALLGLDLGILAGDPTGTNGAMYYNANTNKFRCYQNGAWTDCIATASSPDAFVDGGNSFGVSAELGTLDAFALTFLTNGAGRMFISTDGLVGIGTSSPTATLDVNGNASFSGTLSVGGTLTVSGTSTLQGAVTALDNLTVGASLDVTSGALFRSTINSLGNITLGNGTSVAAPAQLRLDLGILNGDPAGINGGMYYNANTNKFRCYENAGWVNCVASNNDLDASQYDRVVDPGGTGTDTSIAAAISAATAGDSIYIAKGTYSENLTIDKSLLIVGAGRESVTITGATGSPTISISNSVNDVQIKHMTITNSGTASTDDVIRKVTGATGTRYLFEDLEISGGYMGIVMNSGTYATVTNCYILNSTNDGINILSDHPTISYNRIATAGGVGISVADQAQVLSNKIENPTGAGINVISATANTSIIGNNIEDGSSTGIIIDTSSYVTVQGNDLDAVGNSIGDGGILITGSNRVIVSGNNLSNTSGDAIDTAGTISDISITGNSIRLSSGDGIELNATTSEATVTSNTIADGSLFGIQIGATVTDSIIAHNVIDTNTSGDIDNGTTVDANVIVGPNALHDNTTLDLMKIMQYPSAGNTYTADMLEMTMDGNDANSYRGNGIKIIIDQSQNIGFPFLLEDDGAVTQLAITETGQIGVGTTDPGATIGFASAATINLATAQQALNVESGLFNIDTSNSRIGIGTTAPTTKLQIVGGNCSDDAGGGGCTADYAELYVSSEDVEKGDVLVINFAGLDSNTVMRSSLPYQPTAIGIVSTAPATIADGSNLQFMNNEYQLNPRKPAVALAGRVPVKISTDSEPILPGDPLTTSDQTGRAMKATGAGQIIGKALESWNPLEPKDKILTFVNISWQGPSGTSNVLGEINEPFDALSSSSGIMTYDAKGNLLDGDLVSLNNDNQAVISEGLNRDLLMGVAVGDSESEKVKIATIGTAIINVTNENGEIKKGDFITSSDIQPGFGQKAVTSGMVIGRALEDMGGSENLEIVQQESSQSGQPEATPSNTKSKIQSSQIKIMVNVMWYEVSQKNNLITDIFNKLTEIKNDLRVDGNLEVFGKTVVNELTTLGDLHIGLLSISSEDNSINSLGDSLRLQNRFGAKDIEAFGGKMVLTNEGNVKILGRIDADKLSVREVEIKKPVGDQDPIIGEGIISKGDTTATISNTNVSENSKIFISPTTLSPGVQVIVTKKENGSFDVNLETEVPTDIKFDYWIVNTK